LYSGSTTRIPAIEGLKESGYLTNNTLFDLEELPESLTILGAG
jgi:mercuric reductase